MKKGFLLITIMLAMLVFGFAVAETADPVLATAGDGALTVALSEIKSEYDETLAYYAYMYSMYGMSVDEYDTEFQSEIAKMVVENAIDIKVVNQWAEANGYELTETRQAEIEKAASDELEEAREYYRTYLSGYGITGDELEKTVEEEMAASGYTMDAFLKSQKLKDVLAFITEKATADVTVTDEEVKAHFDEHVATQKASYDESADAFINDYMSKAEILYTPEGVRVVKVIYFAKEETGDDATEAEAETTEIPEGTDPATLSGAAKAAAVRALINESMAFDEAMLTYNEDTSSEEDMNAGYPVAAGSTYYSDEFVAAAMALEKTGDVSDVVATDYGYFILMYDHDLAAGSEKYEDHAEAETASMLESKRDEAYSALLETIISEGKVQINDLSSLYHVFVGEGMAEYRAFGITSEAIELTDKPQGDTVAKLEEGAAAEILGKVMVEETEYAFISVLGTELKGYVPAAILTDADEETANGTDNASKTEAVQVESALPIFTVVMKDGSIMYGELYPALAPETVANFVELSNQNFYDGLIFHRVIPGFVIQGGDPNGDGTGGPSYSIKGEFTENGVENTLSHTRGVLSMARSQEYDSAGSQFFIMHADNTGLDGSYAAFGLTLGGLDTLDVIASVPTDSSDKPREDQVIRTVYVETHGDTYEFDKIRD